MFQNFIPSLPDHSCRSCSSSIWSETSPTSSASLCASLRLASSRLFCSPSHITLIISSSPPLLCHLWSSLSSRTRFRNNFLLVSRPSSPFRSSKGFLFTGLLENGLMSRSLSFFFSLLLEPNTNVAVLTGVGLDIACGFLRTLALCGDKGEVCARIGLDDRGDEIIGRWSLGEKGLYGRDGRLNIVLMVRIIALLRSGLDSFGVWTWKWLDALLRWMNADCLLPINALRRIWQPADEPSQSTSKYLLYHMQQILFHFRFWLLNSSFCPACS